MTRLRSAPFFLRRAVAAANGPAAAHRGVRGRLALAGTSLAPDEVRDDVLVEILAHRPDPQDVRPAPVITSRITGRLAPADDEAVAAVLEGGPAELWQQSDEVARQRLTLNFAAFYGLQPVLERAGLVSAMPADEVHAMARGPIAAGGDAYLADLMFDAVERAGLEVPEDGTVLDFGASSGRVLRMVAAGRPDLRCLGCDPNAGAIAWAQEHLPMAEFFVSPQAPPLELADGSVDLAYAVSIWSHFAAGPALGWLEEMHRVLRPGGALVLTTHGFDCLAVQLRAGQISAGTAAAAAAAMMTSGHHFVDVFGEDGDWGVKDPGWGNAYLTLDWLMAHVGDRFSTRLLLPGALDRVQDVIVLERR